jgi:uncharacterized protein YuzE
MEVKLTSTRSLYYNPDTDTLDIWIGDPSRESSGEPLTENLVSKLDSNGTILGFEIIQLSKLNEEDLKKMPRGVKDLLKQSADRLSLVIKYQD